MDYLAFVMLIATCAMAPIPVVLATAASVAWLIRKRGGLTIAAVMVGLAVGTTMTVLVGNAMTAALDYYYSSR
jgi:hypothetical protein